jgi:hypothetical protein
MSVGELNDQGMASSSKQYLVLIDIRIRNNTWASMLPFVQGRPKKEPYSNSHLLFREAAHQEGDEIFKGMIRKGARGLRRLWVLRRRPLGRGLLQSRTFLGPSSTSISRVGIHIPKDADGRRPESTIACRSRGQRRLWQTKVRRP